jgi:uncharacterized protein (DUF983 family)
MRNGTREDSSNQSEEWDDDGYVPCPHCGEQMLEDAEYCPSCDRWMSEEEASKPKSPAWVMVVAAVLLGLMLMSVLRGF